MMQRNRRSIFIFVAAALMLACVPTLAPASAPLPTFDPNQINTAIVETANAAASQTAVFAPPTLTPSVTPLPSNTPSPTPSPTETFVFLLISPTSPAAAIASGTFPSSSKEYACSLVSQAPADNSVVAPGADFDVRWQVLNIGTKTWDSNNADYRYVSGDKLHKTNVYDLYKDIAPGVSADIIADMRAPNNPGVYTTKWAIRIGKNEFCKLTLTIEVK